MKIIFDVSLLPSVNGASAARENTKITCSFIPFRFHSLQLIQWTILVDSGTVANGKIISTANSKLKEMIRWNLRIDFCDDSAI